MALTGIIETTSGDLLRAGYSTFTPGTGESDAPTPLPVPPLIRRPGEPGNHHRWNGSAYIEVAQPLPDQTILVLYDENGAEWHVKVNSNGTLSVTSP